jgi:hypothetical protein
MKKQLFLALVLLSTTLPLFAQYQFNLMEDYIQIGAGNYFVHLDKEAEVKKTVLAVLKANRFPSQDLLFNKGQNLYFAAYYVNPSDDRYMYIIHALRAREGYDLFFLYCANTLTHHFEYTEGKDLYQLIYDPQINNSSVLTSFGATKVEEQSK